MVSNVLLQGNNSKSSERQKALFKFLLYMPCFGIGLVIISCCQVEMRLLATLGPGLLIGGAAYVAGGLGGFLFGLPRYLSNPDSTKKNYSRNDNLIQISDWLTKIIVGLGLTNLYKIPHLLYLFGFNASALFGGTVFGADLAQCILIYFLVSGFLLGYLWTNIHYIPILTEMDEVANNISNEVNAKAEAANAVLDERTESINSTNPDAFTKIADAQKANPQKRSLLSFNDYTSLIDTAKKKMTEGLKAQNYMPANMRDPNKGLWGGKSDNNNRSISATITSIDKDLFKVMLNVVSTNSSSPLEDGDVVLFSLHNTFNDPYKVVLVKNGSATLEFISYGAFTVGVLCDNGNTELEYDLVNIPNAPEKFVNS